MKPLELPIPDAQRKALEESLTDVSITTSTGFGAGSMSEAKKISEQQDADIKTVLDIMFPKNPSRELLQWQKAVRDVHTGMGSPAIHITNLPRQPLGQVFAMALSAGFSTANKGAEQFKAPPFSGFMFGFHRDRPLERSRKVVNGIYYLEAGAHPEQTIFVSADEILHAAVCLSLNLPPDATPETIDKAGYRASYNKERRTWLRKLTDKSTHSDPLLERNPNYKLGKADNAPEFILNSDFDSDLSLLDEAKDALREKAISESTAGLSNNTFMVWNESFVLHDRSTVHPTAEDRRIIALNFNQHHDGKIDTIGHATGAPSSQIDLGQYPSKGQILNGLVQDPEGKLR